MKIKHAFNISNSGMNNLWLRSRLKVMQEKQEVSNTGQAKIHFFSCHRPLASPSYRLCVRSCSVNGVHRDLIPPNTVWEFPFEDDLWEKHLFRTCNEHNTLTTSNDHLCLVRTDRCDHHHRCNYYSCKAIKRAGTSVLTSSLPCG